MQSKGCKVGGAKEGVQSKGCKGGGAKYGVQSRGCKVKDVQRKYMVCKVKYQIGSSEYKVGVQSRGCKVGGAK